MNVVYVSSYWFEHHVMTTLNTIVTQQEKIMATLDDLAVADAALTQAVADLAAREGGESAATQAQVDAAHQAVVDATAAISAMDQPPAPPAV